MLTNRRRSVGVAPPSQCGRRGRGRCCCCCCLPTASRADWFDLGSSPEQSPTCGASARGPSRRPWPVGGSTMPRATPPPQSRQSAQADSTCHMGMSGYASSNFSIMPNNTCVLTAAAAAHTCNCIGVPQCGRGSKCSFDCSCDVQALRNTTSANATLPRMLAEPDAKPVFVGSIKFKDGRDFDVACPLPLDFRNASRQNRGAMVADNRQDNRTGNQFLHGYEVLIRGVGGRDRRCPESETNPPAEQPLTMHSRYECTVTPILEDRPLEVGDIFPKSTCSTARLNSGTQLCVCCCSAECNCHRHVRWHVMLPV